MTVGAEARRVRGLQRQHADQCWGKAEAAIEQRRLGRLHVACVGAEELGILRHLLLVDFLEPS